MSVSDPLESGNMPAIAKALFNGSCAIDDKILNATQPEDVGLQVICAWPVSGQYGPGSRILYYVLVATCVLARKSDWLRNACLAATLLLPMVAAIHGIVLAAVNIDDAVDLDIFGALQLCAVGVLVAPVTARLSGTYFKGPGHNIIILWSLFVVAGLISLVVEFQRVANNTTLCEGDPLHRISDLKNGNFTCCLRCSLEDGPQSPIRGGSGNNIYVIPAPHILTFNVAILISAACCIPAILLSTSLLLRSSKSHWNIRFFPQRRIKLGAFVFVFEPGTEAPTIEQIKDHIGSLTKLGVIRTPLVQHHQHAEPDNMRPLASVELAQGLRDGDRNSVTVQDNDGFSNMFQYLGKRSALTRREYGIWGSTLQVLECKLARSVENDDIATELRTVLQDLDQEGVDAIIVEALPSNASLLGQRLIQQLRDDQKGNSEGAATSRQHSHSGRSLGEYTMVTLCSAAVLAILIVGERNLLTYPVSYQTEPLANVGQWGPIAGTSLLVAGSVYVITAEEIWKERRRLRIPHNDKKNSDGFLKSLAHGFIKMLIHVSDMLNPKHKRFDDQAFEAAWRSYPEVPGENNRSSALERTRSLYQERRDSTSRPRTITSTSPSPRDNRTPSRERQESDTAEISTQRRGTLTPEVRETPPSPHRPRRSTLTSHASPALTRSSSSDNAITIVVTSPND